ncbi:MAG TPA: hypothetical protein VFQ92_17665, partial [Blastocatellia bacterium]|nr:hypothetical protein [Blastocatellia bacterium]
MNEITTLAGGGSAPFKDRGPASEAILEGPSGVAVDDEGNIYIAAFLAKRVFKIDTDGILTVVAGTGEAASSGDGGPAARAPLNGPSAVAFAGGLLYIAEQLGDRIRVVDQSGRINTFAGTGRSPVVGNGHTEKIKDRVKAREAVIEQPAGLAVRDGEVYFTEFAGNRVRKVDRNGVVRFVAGTGQRASNGDGGPATKAALQGPTGLAFDRRGNLYVSEVFSARVRRIDTKGKITTIAGLGKPGEFEEGARARRASLRWPHGLAVDAEGNLFIADFSASRIYVIDSDKLIHTFAGIGDGGTVKTGLASDVPVENPLGLAFDAKGDLLVTLFNQGSVLRINAESRVKRIAGEFVREPRSTMRPTEAFLRGVSSISSDDHGNVYIAEAFGNAIHKVTPKGEMLLVAGTGLASTGEDRRVATRSSVNHPAGVLPTADGVFIAEADGHRIRFIDSSNRISTIAGTGVPGFSGDGGPATAASAAHPHGIMDFGSDVINPVPFLLARGGGRAAARRGKKRAAKGRPAIAFVDTDNHRVRVIDEFGIISTLAGNGKPVSSG